MKRWIRAAVLLVAWPVFSDEQGDRSLPLQPLATFLKAAADYAVDNREARSQAKQQTAEAYLVLARALPSLNAKGVYTYNQYEAVITLPSGFGAGGPLTLVPRHQLDAYFTVSVPLIDVGTWVRGSAAKAAADALTQTVQSRVLDVQKQVARTFYRLVAAEALAASAKRNLQVFGDNLALVRVRREGGVASDLDVERAAAQVEGGKQSVADAGLQVELAHRQLQTLSGLTPGRSDGALQDDLREEAPLDGWLGAIDRKRVPALLAAELTTKASSRNAVSAKLAFLPTIAGQFQEHLTNATGFTGQNNSYLLQLSANWAIDFSTFFNIRQQAALLAVSRAREDRVRMATADSIYESWQRVQTQIVKVRAARAQAQASARAAAVARERYKGGAATQLDVLGAERDAFGADVNLIQAQADLAYARAELRLNAGISLEDTK